MGGRRKGVQSIKSGADEEPEEEREHIKMIDKLKKEDGEKELDADWDSSHDGFRHQSFEHVIQFHDFTLINFFAGWCVHCQRFAPQWKVMADNLHKKADFADKDGHKHKVWPIKMNCVDFRDLCREKGIDAFPTIRLYKSDGTFSLFEGERNEKNILKWIQLVVGTKSYGWKKHHDEFEAGCNARGFLRVPRVPGHLELLAGDGDQNLDPRMTNVSHLVKHLSFSDPRDAHHTQKAWRGLPLDALKHVTPLDGQEFSTSSFHAAHEHHLRVVSTVTSSGVAYQFSHYGRLQRLNESVVPQARFHFDLEPFAIQVITEQKKWYDFVTSLLAILGGIFVVLRLLSMFSLSVVSVLRPVPSNGLPTHR